MKVAQGVAEYLKREGVEFIVAYPVNPIIEAAAVADIRTVIVRQERIGLHMADAVSRLSSGRQLGVFTMQSGPGTENAFGGVAQAYGESAPILVLPMGYSRRTMHVAPNFNAVANFQHVTKWCEPLSMGKAMPEVLRRAFSQLRSGSPGPVMIEVPADVFGEDVPDELGPRPNGRVRVGPDPDLVREAAAMLAAAERPVIYAGQGVHYAEAWDELRHLAELLNAPVTTSLGGKSSFNEDHPLSLGSGGRAVPKTVHEFLGTADVIFGIGCSFTTTGFGLYFGKYPQAKYVHATLDPVDLNKNVASDCVVAGDAKLTLAALIAQLEGRPLPHAASRADSVPAEIERIRSGWLDEWMPKLSSDSAPLSPYRVLWDLMHTVDRDNVIITHDAGSPRDQLSPFWRSTTPLSYIGWGKTTQLGYGLGLAMGAKLAQPDKLCINVWGDAAIGFTGMDFETAVRERLPILSILLNNFSMAIELPIMQVATEKYRSTDISGHYADMAKAFGGYGERITDPAEIVPAIRRGIEATESGTPALLEFITEKEISISSY